MRRFGNSSGSTSINSIGCGVVFGDWMEFSEGDSSDEGNATSEDGGSAEGTAIVCAKVKYFAAEICSISSDIARKDIFDFFWHRQV